ncbi:MAG: TlpA family protein disulfide reductase [Bacteroidetes bacterium]|nr:MAG: TlpA family protein disulfide reductase [Bacteroidota bacterium]
MANKAYYENHFKDTSAIMKNTFYGKATEMLLNNSEWGKLPEYEDLIVDKIISTNMYNAFARNLSEKKDPTDSQLNIAKMISLKSINIIKKRLADIEKRNDDGLLQRNIHRYTATYANILFKLGEYDSAFYFINEIYRQSENVDIKFLEQYSLYSEKAKGDRFTYEFIVQRLLDGVSSTVMLNQMKSISVRLEIPDTVYKSIKEDYDKTSRQKAAADIKAKFGTPKSIGFTLKNLSGTSVSLSSFKNKIIVLDFWASWCLPCLASFPNMQKIINIYKEDKEVVFLFIDTWEQKGDAESNKKAKERAVSILRTNNYTFEVLLDEKNKVANAFKLDAVPMTHIINKNGNIVFMGNTSDLSPEIEKARH